ncbi:hypothetical protein J2N86_05745 [Legionella lytica]|uniref:Dot/Icm T4SS effector n=1 Tax=Legionella lytica TaxID=96232 RepID=A0ABY4YAX2_9GAMM|nr:hypothetical protein [Legionella lytica]USQ14803.1 hypothetical protein J2N86_05745 [Legionella lytica]
MSYFFAQSADKLHTNEDYAEYSFEDDISSDDDFYDDLSTPVNEERAGRNHFFEPVTQLGAHCKLAAIANVEQYFATQMKFEPLPLYKKGEAKYSIRQIGKSFGSSQGEVLEIAALSQIFEVLGYQNTIHQFSPTEYGAFLVRIDLELIKGNLPVIAFPVTRDIDDVEQRGQPNLRPNPPEETEHAAVIIACDIAEETLTLVHWGAYYTVSAQELFIANQQLAETRSVEYYSQTPDVHIRYDRPDKYMPLFSPSVTPAKTSITPSPLSGFKGKLLIAQKPLDLELLDAQRLSLFSSLNGGDVNMEESSSSFTCR